MQLDQLNKTKNLKYHKRVNTQVDIDSGCYEFDFNTKHNNQPVTSKINTGKCSYHDSSWVNNEFLFYINFIVKNMNFQCKISKDAKGKTNINTRILSTKAQLKKLTKLKK